MPFCPKTLQHFDFEQIALGPKDNVADVMAAFFANHRDIVGDKTWITWHIGHRVAETREFLLRQQSNAPWKISGQMLFLSHPVVPDKNGGREHYVYALNVFV